MTSRQGLQLCGEFQLPNHETSTTPRKYNTRAFLGEKGKSLFIWTGTSGIVKTPVIVLRNKRSKTETEISYISYTTKDQIISVCYCNFADRVISLEYNSVNHNFNLVVLDDALTLVSTLKLHTGFGLNGMPVSCITYEAQNSILVFYEKNIEGFTFSYGNRFLMKNSDTDIGKQDLETLPNVQTLVDISLQQHLARVFLCYTNSIIVINLSDFTIVAKFENMHNSQLDRVTVHPPSQCTLENTTFITADVTGSMKIWKMMKNSVSDQKYGEGDVKLENIGLLVSKTSVANTSMNLFNLQLESPHIITLSGSSLSIWDSLTESEISNVKLVKPHFSEEACLVTDQFGVFVLYLNSEDLTGYFAKFNQICEPRIILESKSSQFYHFYSEPLNISRLTISESDRNIHLFSEQFQISKISRSDYSNKIVSLNHSIHWEMLTVLTEAYSAFNKLEFN